MVAIDRERVRGDRTTAAIRAVSHQELLVLTVNFTFKIEVSEIVTLSFSLSFSF
jgi:hypothetical protein